MSRWKEIEKKIFFKHAGKIPDEELAKLINKPFSVVRNYRHYHKIPLKKKPIYTEEMLQYIRDNYRIMSNQELADNLMLQDPHLQISKHAIRGVMVDINCIRTKEEIRRVIERCIERGVFLAAAKKAAKKMTKHQPGVVFNYPYGNSNNLRQCIKVEDSDKPGEYKIILYEKYVWQQHHPNEKRSGVITRIDPNKPITIDNLYIKRYEGLNLKLAAKTLPDWFVVQTLTKKASKGAKEFWLNNPELLALQRMRLQQLQELKAIENAGKSENNTMAETPAKHD